MIEDDRNNGDASQAVDVGSILYGYSTGWSVAECSYRGHKVLVHQYDAL